MESERGAGGRSIRGHNLALLLRLICAEAPVSRVRLAQLSGLTKVTVTALVSELRDAGLVHDLGVVSAAGPGRPASSVAPDPVGPVGIGLQIEVDHIAGCVVDLSGRLRRRELRRATVAALPAREAVRAARPVLRRLFDHATTAGQLVAGIAVAVPGTVSRDADGYTTVRRASSLGWHEVDVRGLLAAETDALGAAGVEVAVDSAVHFAALAEVGHDAGDVLYVGGEADVGAVLLADGVLRRGATGGAGAIGHVRVHKRGPVCDCGGRGCLDRYAGRQAMNVAVGLPETALSRLVSGDEPFVQRVRSGDPDARRVTAAAARALSEVLAPAVALLDPGALVLGGRLAALGRPMLEPLHADLAGTGVPLRVGALGPDAALRGAAHSALSSVMSDPLAWFEGQ